MPSLSELWDENKYSEGDPIRQLIAATKASKQWPMDTLAWGADLVDLSTLGLSTLFSNNQGLSKAIKTDLGGNLRRAFSKPTYNGESSLTEYPAKDIQEGTSVGRMLNPALLANFNIPTKLNKQTKIAKEITENSELVSTLSTEGRRNFIKQLAAITGGALVGGKMLSKFGNKVDDVTKAASKVDDYKGQYKYNSIKEYFDEVTSSKEIINTAFKGVPEEATKLHGPNQLGYDSLHEKSFYDEYSKAIQQKLLRDQSEYKHAKSLLQESGHPEIDPISNYKSGEFEDFRSVLKRKTNEFSPEAKRQMRAWKSWSGKDWKSDTDSQFVDDWLTEVYPYLEGHIE